MLVLVCIVADRNDQMLLLFAEHAASVIFEDHAGSAAAQGIYASESPKLVTHVFQNPKKGPRLAFFLIGSRL